MNGAARTTAAITFVNALPTGIGWAAGIELYAEARVEIGGNASNSEPILEIPDHSRSPVIEESARTAVAQYFPNGGVRLRLSLASEIPVARGLKSSSAVSTAVLLAVARAAGARPSALEIGRASADIGRRVGVSATGALDDALAGLGSGFVLTDNTRGEVLRRTEVDPGLGVVLYVPPGPHPPSPNLTSAFSQERAAGELVASAARKGDWTTAMRLNSDLVERTMGYAYGELRARLRAHGAIASGVSGLGPTLAAIAPFDQLPELLEALPSDSAQKRIVRFRRGSSAPAEDP
jgi:shikimate kinase